MKNKIYYLGILGIMIIVAGATFKLFHLFGAGILLFTGFGLFCLLFMPMAFISSYRSEQNTRLKYLYLLTFLIFLLDFVGALFKILHWPGASWLILISIALIFLVLLPVYVLYNRNDKEINYNNFIAVLIFFAWFAAITALLSTGISKNLIDAASISSNIIDEQVKITGKFREYLREHTRQECISSVSGTKLADNAPLAIDQIILQLATTEGACESCSGKMNFEQLQNKEGRIRSDELLTELSELRSLLTKYAGDMEESVTGKAIEPDLSRLLSNAPFENDKWSETLGNTPLIFVIQQLDAVKYKLVVADRIAMDD